MLQFSVSQQINETPYTFKSTGIRVYSFEESLFHVYHYWRESVDDFVSEEMITWVSELGHSFLSSKIKELASEENFTRQILNFLQLVNYFSKDEIAQLEATLREWELRREWEKLKERADYLVQKGEPIKALPLFKRALQFEENAALLNNLAVAYMQLSLPKEAIRHLTRARTLEPANVQILLHYVEASILGRQFENAKNILAKATEMAPTCADIPFLQGLMSFKQKRYSQALAYYDEAIKLEPTVPYYIYKKVDVHKAMRQYEKALESLAAVSDKNGDYYVKEAEIHAMAGDVPAALRSMRRATTSDTTDANLWAKLAEYYRNDYDWRRAEQAIAHAISLSPDNDTVRLESARIKKGLGRTKDYQTELTGILKSFKERYRAEI